MAGLSERKVVTTPREEAPGMPKIGFISGWSRRFSSDTKPNSDIRPEMAPMMTQMAVSCRTVSFSRSSAVFSMVPRALDRPIFQAKRAKIPKKNSGNRKVSSPSSFLNSADEAGLPPGWGLPLLFLNMAFPPKEHPNRQSSRFGRD